jgi:hypothetical protein
MVEEITIDGMPYIAARNAAALVGMSPDYLTRWCREGLVEARRITSGIWFVNLPSLKQHLNRVLRILLPPRNPCPLPHRLSPISGRQISGELTARRGSIPSN